MSDSKNLSLLWGFPCGGQVPAPWLRHICGVFDRTKHGTSMPLVANQSATLDLARSWMIEVARKEPRYDWLIQVETDKWIANTKDPSNPDKPWASLDAIIDILEEDRAFGFDAVFGPTMSPDGVPNFGMPSAESWEDVGPNGPSEAQWSGLAFFAMSRKCLDGLKILDYAKSSVMRPEGPDDKGQPMFCKMNLPQDGEDVSLCRNIRESGFKLAIDPRIPVGPAKAFPQFISRECWPIWRKMAKARRAA